MKLLVLGGTKNLGRHVVEAALRDGHEVTLFNRGQTNPDLFRRSSGSWGSGRHPAYWPRGSGTA